jgi:hypothetical protein
MLAAVTTDTLARLMKVGSPAVDLEPTKKADLERLVDSFGEAAQPATPGLFKSFGGSLAPIARNGTGGRYATWKLGPKAQPVVYFGTEGQLSLAAPDFDAFLGLFAYGGHVHDLMAYWRLQLTSLESERSPRDAPASPPVIPEVAALLPVVASNPSAIVEEANRAFLWKLIDTVDLAVTKHTVYRKWFDAWNACKDESAVRLFSPTERYEPGALIRYEWKYSWGSGVSRGIVLGNPAPDRVLIGSKHNTFLRACARRA